MNLYGFQTVAKGAVGLIKTWENFDSNARQWYEDQAGVSLWHSTPEAFLALGYKTWLKNRPDVAKRRTMEVFENHLKELHNGRTIPSLFRKLKGKIRPSDDELKMLLTTLFAEPLTENKAKVEDVTSNEEFVDSLVERLLNKPANLAEDKTSGRIFASQGSVILGPDDHQREEAFRDFVGSWLDNLRRSSKFSPSRPLPMTNWIFDVSPFREGGEPAYDVRRAITSLASAILSLLATKWIPPESDPSMEFSADSWDSLSQGVKITRKSSAAHLDEETDLRRLFLENSTICLVGMPAVNLGRPETELALEGYFGQDFFTKALMPEALISYKALSGTVADNARVDRIMELMGDREVCLATNIDYKDLEKIGGCISDKIDQLDKIQGELALKTNHFVYWYEEQSANDTAKAEEQTLSEVPAPPAVQVAMFTVLVAAATRLDDQIKVTKKDQQLKIGTIGRDVTDMLLGYGVRVMTIGEFLDFQGWFPAADEILNDYKEEMEH
ncbi:hypothetical protein [Parasphingorhabdus sp.]|uniref:hypothetical protein n=1 Tax=Parasphingorhabdus sp. TaxID=2709688 RepID=UPI003593FD7A